MGGYHGKRQRLIKGEKRLREVEKRRKYQRVSRMVGKILEQYVEVCTRMVHAAVAWSG